MSCRFRSGFTILELLIVIAAVGLLVVLGAFSLSSARSRLRDTQRVSDISVLRSTLSQYWLEKATYPVSDGVNLGQTDPAMLAPYLPRIPVGPKVNEFYKYRGGAQGYSLRFQTERDTAFGKSGVYYAHTSGIDTKDEIK
ncbi:prepilin-type N-terminal cleavage/methylation domain-containing protein [Candidatus Uhrbacteria bacterium]|nr:prepilin-type N-terminal cleavage/methylation domain-containing protein [Candidatus Uhrbacteria bacterium]